MTKDELRKFMKWMFDNYSNSGVVSVFEEFVEETIEEYLNTRKEDCLS